MSTAETLRRSWNAHVHGVRIEPAMTLTEDGLVLGAGTMLLQRSGPANGGGDERVLALLTVAYGRRVSPSVLGNIRRAARCWSARDKCLALIHLARSGCRHWMRAKLRRSGCSPPTACSATASARAACSNCSALTLAASTR
jgi:hypothetical protein